MKYLSGLMFLLLAGNLATAHPGMTSPAKSPGKTDDFMQQVSNPITTSGDIAPPAVIRLPENVTITRLENGMEVLLVHNPLSTMVGMNVQVLTGSAIEDYRTSGMSHFLEHLLFNGTESRTQEELYAETDLLGAYNNANTAETYINYMMVVPADKIREGMDIQSDMLFHSTLPKAKFEKERGIILEELVQGRDDPDHQLDQLLKEVVFSGSNLTLPVLGTFHTIQHLSRDEVYDYYKAHYVPNNMRLSVVGNFPPDKILDLLEKYYGAAAPGTIPPPAGIERPGPLEQSIAYYRRLGDTPRLYAVFNAPSYHDNNYAAFQVLLKYLESDAEPLKTLLQKAGLDVSNLNFDYYPWDQASRLVIQLQLEPGTDPNTASHLLDKSLRDLAATLRVDPEFLEGLVNREITDRLILLEKPHYFGMMHADLFANAGLEFFFAQTAQLRRVTAEDLPPLVAGYLVDQPSVILAVEPEMKTETSVQAESRARKTVLKSGAVLLTVENPDSRLFALHILVRDRALHETPRRAGAVNILHELMLKGTRHHNGEELSRLIHKYGIVLKLVDLPWIPFDDYYTNSRFSFLRLECEERFAVPATRLLVEMLTEPLINAENLEQVRSRILARVGREANKASTLSRRLFQKALLGDHPDAQPVYGTAETLNGLTVATLDSLAEEYFAPDNLILSVVSPLSADSLATLFNGLLPADRHTRTVATSPWPLTTEPVTLNEDLGKEQARVRLGYITEIDPADAPALKLLLAIISDKMAMDLRETKGLAYSLGAWADVRANRAEIGCSMGTRPENLEQVLPALRRYITAFDTRQITAQDLEKTVQSILGHAM